MSTTGLAAASPAELDATTIDGKSFRLPEHRGKVVLIDFWATWCPPCRSSLAHYASLHERYGAKGLVVVAVTSEEDRLAVQRFVEELSLSFPIIHDPEGSIAARFAPDTMPTAFLVNDEGFIVETFAGFNSGDEATIEKAILALLGKDPKPFRPPEKVLTSPLRERSGGHAYRHWSYGLWSTGAVLLGASGYLYLGPLQDSIKARDTNYKQWQNTAPSPQFESFERAFLEAEGRAEKQEAWSWILAGAGLTTVVAGFVTWFSQPIDVAPDAVTMRSNLRVNLIPRWNSHTPGFDVHLTW